MAAWFSPLCLACCHLLLDSGFKVQCCNCLHVVTALPADLRPSCVLVTEQLIAGRKRWPPLPKSRADIGRDEPLWLTPQGLCERRLGLSGLQRSWAKQAGRTVWRYCMGVPKVSLVSSTLLPHPRTGEMQWKWRLMKMEVSEPNGSEEALLLFAVGLYSDQELSIFQKLRHPHG